MNAVKTDHSIRNFLPESCRMNGDSGSANANRERVSHLASVRCEGGTQELDQLLTNWREGDQAALKKLIPLVYEELRHLAHRYMETQRPDHTLQTTALVNEAYLRLADQTKPNFANRSHFFAVAAKAMRQILVDHAKAQQRQKRGAGASKVELDEAALISPEQANTILDVNEALERLAALDSRAAQGVELRYFGGLNQDETAEVLKISAVTVRRDWLFAKAWLHRELRGAA
jgi:RNA polymerase sigma-70 factor (ECF subfamily)